MKTITEQLADALRALQAQHCTHFNGSRWKDSDDDAQAAADRALAAYDAQQAVPPTCNPIAPGETIGETVDRLLGMADQFLEDWGATSEGEPDYVERKAEWGVVRPLILQRVNAHDTLVSALRTILADKGSANFNDDLEAYDAAIQTASDALAQVGVTP